MTDKGNLPPQSVRCTFEYRVLSFSVLILLSTTLGNVPFQLRISTGLHIRRGQVELPHLTSCLVKLVIMIYGVSHQQNVVKDAIFNFSCVFYFLLLELSAPGKFSEGLTFRIFIN